MNIKLALFAITTATATILLGGCAGTAHRHDRRMDRRYDAADRIETRSSTRQDLRYDRRSDRYERRGYY